MTSTLRSLDLRFMKSSSSNAAGHPTSSRSGMPTGSGSSSWRTLSQKAWPGSHEPGLHSDGSCSVDDNGAESPSRERQQAPKPAAAYRDLMRSLGCHRIEFG